MTTKPDIYTGHNEPRYIEVYELPKTTCTDRFTVVFTGVYKRPPKVRNFYRGMDERPTHALGMGYWGEILHSEDPTDSTTIGTRIKFTDLSENCQSLIRSDYAEVWDASV